MIALDNNEKAKPREGNLDMQENTGTDYHDISRLFNLKVHPKARKKEKSQADRQGDSANKAQNTVATSSASKVRI